VICFSEDRSVGLLALFTFATRNGVVAAATLPLQRPAGVLAGGRDGVGFRQLCGGLF